jgi:hypothetical protein
VDRLDLLQFLERVLGSIDDLPEVVRDDLRRLAVQEGGDRSQLLQQAFLKAQEDG